MEINSLIAETLHKKYLNSQLAGVYLTKYSNEESMLLWAQSFIDKITKTSNHPDILWVERDEKEKDYKVDSKSIAGFINFLNYRPYELKTKIVFIRDAHLLSLIVANKLLKTLEEMPSFISVFLLAPQDESLLQTVESRAIRINLVSNAAAPLHSWQNNSSPQEVLELIKKSGNEHLLEKSFMEHIINSSLTESNYNEISRLLLDLELYDKSSAFNNAALPRMTIIKK